MYPTGYEWLGTVGVLPKMVSEALEEFGVTEYPGIANAPKILGWAKEVGETKIGWKYTADSIPWCGLFMAVVAQRAGKPIPKSPLWARSWSGFGLATNKPVLGDTLVFSRDGGGHVGLYIGEDRYAYYVLGGNQLDSVSIVRISKQRCIAMRTPPVKYALPRSAKPYYLKVKGGLSVNEA